MRLYEELKTGVFDDRYQRSLSMQTEPTATDFGLNILDIFLSTFLVVALYCGIPFLVAKFSKKQWSVKKRRAFVVCNAVISYFIIAGIKIILDPVNAAPPNIAAAAFWSFVASTLFQRYHPESKKIK